MATWPSTLPQDFIEAEWRESPPDNLIRSSMDVGPDKVRRRSTSNPRPVSARMIMTTAQVATFETFYITTLISGSLTFDIDHPRTETEVEMRFVTPPEYTPAGGGYWWVDMQLEILP